MLMGPTACGKTTLAMALHRVLPVDIISVDSAMVYRGMNIGTAKPTPDELASVPHALVDIREPANSYSVAEFCNDAGRAITASIASHRIPLLVGGTMMYFKALLEGLAEMPATDTNVRAEIAATALKQGWPALHRQLLTIDPDYARTIHPNHSQRISRALEVYYTSGKTMSSYRRQHVTAAGAALHERYRIIQIGLLPSDRRALHQCIARRFESMLASGFIAEVESLWRGRGLSAKLPSLRTVGYRQLWQYLNGDYDYDTMVAKGIAATRQLAKRQLTWLRRWPDLHCVTVQSPGDDANIDCQIAKMVDQIVPLLPIEPR